MATGAITITAGKVWNEITGEVLDLAKLNQTANPTARVDANTIGRRELITAFVEQVDDNIAGLAAEIIVRADADTALAGSITSLTSTVNGNTAAITTEATTRATNDGYLAGSYVVRVDANGNQAGLAITAISDPSGWTTTSEVSITASVFKVANGATKVVPFQITGTKARFTADVEIDGSLLIAGTLTLGQVSGAGNLAALNSVDLTTGEVTNKSLANLDSTANTKLAGISAGADVTLSAVNGGLSVTGGGITLASGSPSIKAGQTDYDTGTGFFLGMASGSPRFSIGNSGGKKLTFDGSNLNIKADQVIIGTAIDDTVGELQVDGDLSSRQFGSGAQNAGLRVTVAQGSLSSPSATASASFAALTLRGYDGSSYVTPSSIRLKAASAFSVGSNPTEMEFIVNSGAASNYLYLASDGKLEFGAARDTNLYRANANELATDDDFIARGYRGRAGVGGATGNTFNFHWTGSKVQIWVDTTMVWEQP